MECCRSPELLLLLRLSSASNCQLHSSMTVTASHVRRSFNVFCNWSYVSETRLMLQCLTTHSLTSGAPPALSATRAMFLKQDPCCRRKTFTTEPFFFFLKQKVYCRNLLKQDTRCRKKKPSLPNRFSLSETSPVLQKSTETRPLLQEKNWLRGTDLWPA